MSDCHEHPTNSVKLEDFFKDAFYINLDDRLDRKEHMDKELAKQGLSNFIKRYSAIKAEVKSPENCVRASGTSHRNLIQYAKDNNLENILIVEDDIFFKEGGLYIIEASLCNLQKIPNWDIYYMSANIFDNPLTLVDKHLLKVSGCYCVHAYGVNNRAYDRLLQYDPMTCPPIDAYITQNRFEKYAAFPLAVSQYDSVSDNIGGFIGYDKIFTDVYNRPIRYVPSGP
jgi:GR25 family glycosyltransferase involved in LPS biosynthesis